jgi:hypothetical protein
VPFRLPRARLRVVLYVLLSGALLWHQPRVATAEVSARQVLDSIEKAKRMLLKSQQPDGSWSGGGAGDTHTVGVSSLALLALLNTGMVASDPEIQRGLGWLRRQQPTTTYEISLMIQALAAAKDGRRDLPIVAVLVKDLEEMQVRQGPNSGSWSYNRGNMGGGDRSNGQFAVLGLREAQEMGVPVSIKTWRQARAHWLASQNPNGAWSYSGGGQPGGSGSMTVAGIATLVITQSMLRAEERELNADGTPACCGEPQIDKNLEDAYRWLGENFAVTNNPGDGRWVLYYLYGLERAGRFSGRRFFVNRRGQKHDWYREGVDYLVATQNQFSGTWKEGDQNAIVGTSFVLMFLSKGLAPVLVNKLQYGQRDANRQTVGIDWNRHPDDIRNLTQLISNRPKWPRLLTWQTVDAAQASVADLMQAPILFISGSEAPQFTREQVELLKEYVLQGGFILFVNNTCQGTAFDEGFRDLVRQMYPPSEAQLKKLGADHPVFRSEFLLIDEKTGEPTAELWGVDVGCRTSIMYSPVDLACLWDKYTSFDVPGRPKELMAMISKATRVGVNIVAYVTGREILNKIQQQEQVVTTAEPEKVERDLLEIKKIRYTGDWDAAPQALRNLLVALNRTAGLAVSTRPRDLQILDPQLTRTAIMYMHGRHDFALGKAEQDKLREYIVQGGSLFSDACCGVPAYDRSFRRLMEQLFKDNPLKRIPPDHELFTTKIGHDLKLVERREPDVGGENAGLGVAVRNVEPFLEGIEINGRFVVIYSKYDISCALERQASVACTGYVHKDAVRLGVNVILYFMDQ